MGAAYGYKRFDISSRPRRPSAWRLIGLIRPKFYDSTGLPQSCAALSS